MKIKLLILAGILALTSSTLLGKSIPPTSRSNYGGTFTGAGLYLVGSSESIDGFTVELVCPNSDGGGSGSCSSVSDELLEIITPNVAQGSTINITGAGETFGVYCAGSFFGDCTGEDSSGDILSGATLTSEQSSCLSGINDTYNSSTGLDQISVPTCTLATDDGTVMAFLFNDTSIPTSLTLSTTPPSGSGTVPEPGSAWLLAIGMIGLWSMRRAWA